MPKTRALNDFLARERSGLGERLLPAMREHLAQLRAQDHRFYGYALSFGLEPNLASPVPLTNTLQDVEGTLGTPDYDYMFYGCNEWQHSWLGLACFAEVDAWVSAMEEEFAALHEPHRDPERLDYDVFEYRHKGLHQQAVLEGLISARQAGLFKPEELVLIDISGSAWDTGEAIVAQAAERLNPGKHWIGFQCVLD